MHSHFYNSLENSCPPGVLSTKSNIYLQVHEGSCFRFVTYRMRDYNHASGDCRQDGRTLAMPKTHSLDEYLITSGLNITICVVQYGLVYMTKLKKRSLCGKTTVNWVGAISVKEMDQRIILFVEGLRTAIDPTKNGQWHDFQCKRNFVSVVTGSNPKKRYICQYTLDFVEDKVHSDVKKGDRIDNGHRDKDQQHNDQLNKDQRDKNPKDKDQIKKNQQDKDQQDKD